MNRKLKGVIASIIFFAILSLAAVSVQASKHNTITGGTLHSAAIKSDGSLWTWGYNTSGQLCNGSTLGVPQPIKVMDGAASVCAGEWSTAIIKNDGSLWMCGGNGFGQLGNGNTQDISRAVKVMDNVASVSTAGFFTAAIKNDKSLWICGSTLGGDILYPKKIMDDVEQVSTGGWHTAVIKSDRSLWMWGHNTSGQIGLTPETEIYEPVKIMDNVASVSLGTRHSAVIKTDGSLWTWGDNEHGKLGNGTIKSSNVPVKIMDDVASVSLGDDHTAAIKTDGSLWICGYNWNGELGNGAKENESVPIKIMDNVVSVDLGNNHALAVKADGSLWTWGANRAGQAGVGHTEYAVRVPTKILDNIKLPDVMPYDVYYESSSNTAVTSFGAKVSGWTVAEIENAFNNNLIPETLMELDLTQKVSRSEFAAIAVKLYEALSGGIAAESVNCDFKDISGDKNESAIKKAYKIGITGGTSETKYEPYSNLTREQLVTMLCRVIKKTTEPGWTLENDSKYYMDISGVQKFGDDAYISDWAKPSVYYLFKHGIIKGVNNTHFAPKNIGIEQEMTGYASATREQAIIISQRIFMNSYLFDIK